MRLPLTAALAVLPAQLLAQPVQPPAGWTVTRAGVNWIYAPSNFAGMLTVTIEPMQPSPAQGVSVWLVAQAQADVSQRGTLIGPITPRGQPNGSWIATAGYKDAQGHPWVAVYSAMPRGGMVQLGSVVTDVWTQSVTPYIKTAGSIIASASAPQVAAAAPKRHVDPPTPTLAAPSKSSNFVVVHEGRGESTLFGFQFIESVDLLFTDGWAYLGVTVPPEWLDVAASKQQEPTKWCHWKQQGKTFMTQDQKTGQWSNLGATSVRPLPAGAALNINVSHRSSYAFGGMGSVNSQQVIAFNSNGHFERSSGTIAGSGAMQATGGFSAGAASYRDKNGRSSAAGGGNGSVTATSRSQGSGDPNLAGTYKVSGYTLEFYGGGGTVTRVIAFYPFDDNNSIYIDGATYSHDKP